MKFSLILLECHTLGQYTTLLYFLLRNSEKLLRIAEQKIEALKHGPRRICNKILVFRSHEAKRDITKPDVGLFFAFCGETINVL